MTSLNSARRAGRAARPHCLGLGASDFVSVLRIALACSLLGWSAVTLAQSGEPATPSIETPKPPLAEPLLDEPPLPEPLYAAPTWADRAGRILATVEVNGQGPFRFILDTGANWSALSPELVELLQLPLAEGVTLEVQGVTGAATLPAVRVESLRAGKILLPPGSFPVLPGDVLGRADGILGISGLQGARIFVDFANDNVVIEPSTGRRPVRGYLRVPVKIAHGGLLQARGRVGRINVKVIIDTGAERTLGNLPLLQELQRRRNPADETDTNVLGATSTVSSDGKSLVAPKITIGDAELSDLIVTFGDLHAFKVWGLATEPAILVGMDLLGLLQELIIDYRRKELYLKAYPAGNPRLEHCATNWCGTRIPQGRP